MKYHPQVLSDFGDEMDKVWGKKWKANTNVGKLRMVLLHRPGPEFETVGQKTPFPSLRFFQEKGFRVLPSPWRNPESATEFLQVAKQDATEKMLGVLFTGWSVRPEALLTSLKSEPKPFTLSAKPSREETTEGVAATIRAGLKEVLSPAE